MASIERSRATRGEVFGRDLKEIVGRLDPDERVVLDTNLEHFVEPYRVISPLLLPRTYFSALPASEAASLPRQPPRNCYVELIPSKHDGPSPDDSSRICIYVINAKPSETYLYLAMSFTDNDIAPLRTGDTTFTADAWVLRINYGLNSGTWWLTFQTPKKKVTDTQFELTAFQELTTGHRVLDKRFEGWAYTQKQQNGTDTVRVIARLDLKSLKADLGQSEAWPPLDFRSVTVAATRQNVDKISASKANHHYAESGRTALSFPFLAAPIFTSYATLLVLQDNNNSPPKSWDIQKLLEKTDASFPFEKYGRLASGDLVINHNPITKRQSVPDTSITLEVRHPGTVIEKAIWLTGLLLLIPILGFVSLTIYLVVQLLVPIFRLSREANSFLKGNNYSAKLPFSERHNEVGILSSSINRLLYETTIKTQRHHEERLQVEEDKRRSEAEIIKRRERSLRTVGHEIRSPLQALLSLNGEDSPSRRYLDRIHAAIKYLFSDAGPESSFDSRPIILEEIDLVEFLDMVSINAPLAGISNVVFASSIKKCLCMVDSSVLEDAITNILANANRYRPRESPINIALSTDYLSAKIRISNQGPRIPDEQLESIFELYFTTESTGLLNHGIGLYAARNYLSRMSGSVLAANFEYGVVFEIDLPVSSV